MKCCKTFEIGLSKVVELKNHELLEKVEGERSSKTIG
jgi:hypothetical protein